LPGEPAVSENHFVYTNSTPSAQAYYRLRQ
jgi:hypothetical protein